MALTSVRSARAQAAPANTKVAVGFSNLLARIDKDEIGFAKPEYRVHILEALRHAGFNAVGAENLVFDKDNSDKADFVLGGTVTELDCLLRFSSLRCRIGIEWQLLDRERDEVVYQVLTRFVGLGLPQRSDPSVGKMLTLGALSRLMDRPRFKELLNEKQLALPSETTYPAATFRSCDTKAQQLPGDFEAVADGTVVIKSRDGFGSGFFLGPDGLLMTAAHVVSTGSAEVRLHDGKTVQGRVIRISHKHDVALIALAGAGAGAAARSCLALDPSRQAPGTDVYAIGSPASEELAFSLSRGIVSGVRTVADVPLIQTDASLSPGNSGGALVDQQGRVIGVVSRKIAGRAVEGLGFAIPIQAALAALQLEPGTVTAPILLQQGAVPDEPKPTHARVVDTPDPQLSLEPEVEQQRLLDADYERRLKEQRDRTPGYLLPMRWGGFALAGTGAIVTIISWAGTNDLMTHAEYRTARLTNDLGWTAMVLGTGAFVTSFVIQPKLAPPRVQNAGGWSLLAGPGNIKLDVTF